jgi:hypothetical protein
MDNMNSRWGWEAGDVSHILLKGQIKFLIRLAKLACKWSRTQICVGCRAGNARDIFMNNSKTINNVGLVQRFPYLQMILHEEGCRLKKVGAKSPRRKKEAEADSCKTSQRCRLMETRAKTHISDSLSLAPSRRRRWGARVL